MSTYDNLKSVVRISGPSSDQIMVNVVSAKVGYCQLFCTLSTLINCLMTLKFNSTSGYGSRVMSVSCGNPAFALGILYSYNWKYEYKDKISHRLQKATNALFSLSAQDVHAQGVNPLVSVDVYSNVVIPIALYGSELWNNLTH